MAVRWIGRLGGQKLKASASLSDAEKWRKASDSDAEFEDDEFADGELIDDVNLASDSDAEFADEELIDDVNLASDSDAEFEDGELIDDVELASDSNAELIEDGELVLDASLLMAAPMAEVPIESIKILNKPAGTIYLSVGDTCQLEVGVEPENATSGYYFSSDNKSVLSVDEDGLITANKAGSTSVYAIANNSYFIKDSIYVYVVDEAVKVTLHAIDGYFENGRQSLDLYVKKGSSISFYRYYPSMEGKLYTGKWYADKKCTELVTSNTYYYPETDIDLYTKLMDYYTITYDYNGVTYNGEDSKKYEVLAGESLSSKSPYIPTNKPLDDGNMFAGWRTESGELLSSSDLSYYFPVKNETFTAEWTSGYYTITFDYNGVSYNNRDSYVCYVLQGNNVNSPYLPSDPEQFDGKMFVGWKNKNGEIIENTYNYVPKESETLTAEWTEDYYTITFDYNGVTYNGATSSKYYVLPGKRIGNGPYFSSDPNQFGGKMFSHWQNESGEVVEDTYNYVPTASETLTAVWIEDYYTITFDYDGVSYNGKTSSEYYAVPGKSVSNYPSFPSNPVQLDGKMFLYWINEKGEKINRIYDYIPEKSETLTAVWTEDYYTIHFTGNNGSGGEIDRYSYVLPGNSLNNIPSFSNKPSAAGKILLGWQNSEKEIVISGDASSYRPARSETLTALWSDCYKVTFDADGGSFSTKAEYVPVGQPITKAYKPEKDGYQFAGWYEKESGISVVNYYYIPTKDVTLVARWGEYWTITYDANGGDYTYDSYKSDSVIKGESVYLNSSYGYERDGYTLIGWCEDKACKGKVLSGNYTPVADVTLYAKWGKTCKITFDAGEGYFSGGKKTEIKEVAAGETFYDSTVYNDNATLDGWYTKNGIRYTDAYIAEGDETFYAKWISNNTHTVTFHGGGMYLYDYVEQKYYSTITCQVEDGYPVREVNGSRNGYDCAWYLDSSFKTPYNFNNPVEKDLDLYAKWVKQIYLTWDAKGGKNSSGKGTGSNRVTQGEAYNLPDVTKDGYYFDGWYTLDGQPFNEQTHLYESVSVYAKWAEGYQVTLKLDGGNLYVNGRYSTAFCVKPGNSCGYIPDPRKENAVFTGWYDEAGKKISSISSYVPKKNTVITARWITNVVQVRFHGENSCIYDPYAGKYVTTLVVYTPKNGVLPYSYYSREPREVGLQAFAGWSLTKNGTDVIEEDTYIFTKDTDLYPVWGESWKVTMNYMGGFYSTGTGNYTSQSVIRGEEISYPQSKYMHRDGYTFDGWYENTDYTGTKYEIPFTPKRNMTLYAKWIEGDVAKYTVSFDTSGGTSIVPQKVVYESSAVKPEDPKKNGCIFDGWYTEPQAWYLYRFNEAVYKDITLYAKWLETTNVNDADISINGSYTYTGDVIIPKLQVTMGGQILAEGIDYTVTGNSIDAGKGYVTITGIGDYEGETQVTFTIEKAELPVQPPMGPFKAVYGDQLSAIPEIDMLLAGWQWENPDDEVGDVGDQIHKIIYLAPNPNNYKDSKSEVTVTVAPRSLEGAEISIEDEKLTYTGEPLKPSVSVSLGANVISSEQYTVSYENNVNAGSDAKVIVTGNGNYTGHVEKNFTIEKADPELSIGNPVNAVYGQKLSDVKLASGWAWKYPDTKVDKIGSMTFVADYTAPADSNYNSKKDVALKVTVEPRSITKAQIEIEKDFYIVTGTEIEPVVTVSDIVFGETRKLVKDTDYIVSYDNNVEIGEGSIKITGKGNYKDFRNLTFRIIEDPYNIADAAIVLNPKAATYTGNEIKPDTIVTLAGKTLVRDTDYTVSYANNVEPGYGVVTVTGTGTKGTDTYYGQKKAYFFIAPINYNLEAVYSQKLKELKLPVGWKWQDADSFVGDVTEADTEGRAFKADFRSADLVKENVEFFVKVSPKKIADPTVKKLFKDTDHVYDPENPATVQVTLTDEKTGLELVEGTDYKIRYEGNDTAGRARVILEGINNYTGIYDSYFEIDRAESELEIESDKLAEETIHLTIKDKPFFLYASHRGDGEISFTSTNEDVFKVEKAMNDYHDAEDGLVTVTGVGEAVLTIKVTETTNYKGAELVYRVIVSPVSLGEQDIILKKSAYEFTGQQIKPEFEVIVNGETLTEGTDYTVSYGQNVKPGKNAGSVTISGIQDYMGTVMAVFDIEKAENPAQIPEAAKAVYGQKLSEVALEGGWTWKEPDDYVGDVGSQEKEAVLAETENYKEKSGMVTIQVLVKKLTADMVTLEYSETSYDGTAKEPVVTVTDGELMTEADYQVQYENNLDAGTAVVTVSGTRNYQGQVRKSFIIGRAAILPEHVTVADTSVYDGTRQMPEVTVLVGSAALTADTDYEVSYGENINAGEDAGTVIVTGKGNYTGTAEVTFEIHKAERTEELPAGQTAVYGQKLSELDLDGMGEWNFRTPENLVGSAGEQSHEVYLAETENYKEKSGFITITVAPKALTEEMVKLEYTETEYDTSYKEPSVTVEDNDLAAEDDYTVSYKNNQEIGTAVVLIEGKNNYQGQVELSFTIQPGVVRESNLEVSAESTFDGTQKKPALTVSINGYTLIEGTDYTVTYGENIHAGKDAGTVYVTGIGKFSGTAEVKFTILQAVNPQAAPGEMKAVYGQKLSTIPLADGWQWKLPGGVVGNAGTNEIAVYLPATQDYQAKSAVVTIAVTPKLLTADMLTVSSKKLVYDGTEKCPDISMKDTLAVLTASDYTVTYDSNIHAGTGTVAVTGTRNYQGTIKKSFRIEKAVPVITVKTGPSLEMYLSEKSFDIGAKISNNGTLKYTSSNEKIASVDSNGVVTLLTEGSVVITVLYGGNQDYQEASVDVALQIKKKNSSSSGNGSGGSSSGGRTEETIKYTCLPEGYAGGTQIINRVKVPDYVVSGSWSQIQDGNWNFAEDDGNVAVDRWVAAFNPYANLSFGQSAYDWFLFDAKGNMVTGWYTDAIGDTYYLNPVSDNTKGRMATGWWLIDGVYYYFSEISDGRRGRLLKNTVTPDGWYVDKKGARGKKMEE